MNKKNGLLSIVILFCIMFFTISFSHAATTFTIKIEGIQNLPEDIFGFQLDLGVAEDLAPTDFTNPLLLGSVSQWFELSEGLNIDRNQYRIRAFDITGSDPMADGPIYSFDYLKSATEIGFLDKGFEFIEFGNIDGSRNFYSEGLILLTALDSEGATFYAVPIPGAVWLLGSGLVGLICIGRKRSKR